VQPSNVLYKEVEISSAEILDLHNTAVELLPAISNGVYLIEKMMFSLSAGTDAYNTADANTRTVPILSGNGGEFAFIDNWIIKNTDDCYVYFYPSGSFSASTDSDRVYAYPTYEIGGAIKVGPTSQYTDGNGTILVKIWYTVETFGSNL
jgi:hypothetical protein